MLQRPNKPTSGIKKLNFKLDENNLFGFREFITSFTDDDWTRWSYRQNEIPTHKHTETIRFMWLDLLITVYSCSDSVKFEEFDKSIKFLGNLFLYLERLYEGKVCRVILTKQKPNSTIPIHTDKGFSLTHTHRVHIPFFTNNDIMFYCGSDVLNMEIGNLYEINNQLLHKVVNNTDEVKIHLIVDVIENLYIDRPIFQQEPLFVHIPKTAGTSISFALSQYGCNKWNRNPFYKNHDPLFLLEENNTITDDTYIFAVVRNPYTRAYSYYHHFKQINKVDITFINFLNFVRNRIPFYKDTPLVTYNQTWYLYNKSGSFGMNKTYKFEELDQLEYDFGVFLENLNIGQYSQEQYYIDYDEQAQNLVYHLFYEDFKNCDYSMEFV